MQVTQQHSQPIMFLFNKEIISESQLPDCLNMDCHGLFLKRTRQMNRLLQVFSRDSHLRQTEP